MRSTTCECGNRKGLMADTCIICYRKRMKEASFARRNRAVAAKKSIPKPAAATSKPVRKQAPVYSRTTALLLERCIDDPGTEYRYLFLRSRAYDWSELGLKVQERP